jgi:hypothetical protein
VSLLQPLIDGRIASRSWRHDTSVFIDRSAPSSAHEAVRNRLGWLDAPEKMRAETPGLRTFSADALAGGPARALGEGAARHFVAVTDPGTPLVSLARERGYRRTFVNPPDIGGRYSALSLFGLVPGTYYSFGVLKQARALGDFKALTEAGQDIVHLHLESASVDPVAAIDSLLRVRVGAH